MNQYDSKQDNTKKYPVGHGENKLIVGTRVTKEQITKKKSSIFPVTFFSFAGTSKTKEVAIHSLNQGGSTLHFFFYFGCNL